LGSIIPNPHQLQFYFPLHLDNASTVGLPRKSRLLIQHNVTGLSTRVRKQYVHHLVRLFFSVCSVTYYKIMFKTPKGGSRKNEKGPREGLGTEVLVDPGQSPGRGSGRRSPQEAEKFFFAFW